MRLKRKCKRVFFKRHSTVIKHYSRDIVLIYRLSAEKAPDFENDIGDGMIYSISVTKIDNGGARETAKDIFDVSRSLSEAKRILRLISCGSVFPSEAEEIIGDIISIMPV